MSLSAMQIAAPAAGGTTSLVLSTEPTCSWDASSSAAWLVVEAPAATGSASLSLTAAENTASTPRTATVTVNGRVITVEQVAALQARQLTFGAPDVSPGPQVPLFGKLEIAFDISGSTATNPQWPFDLSPPSGVPAGAGISVDAEFTDPKGNRFVQPAFYSQEYRDEVRDGRDWHLPTGVFRWKVRFSPNREGRWQFRLRAKDRGGVAESAWSSVLVVPSASKGFIKVSADDPRYFEFDDGSGFFGTGVQMREFLEDPVVRGDVELSRLGTNGMSFVRMWISSIFGSAWTSWIGGRNQYRGYLPVTGLLPVADPRTGETELA
ncbi:MAG: BACON domain-containing carbohydrate-binding protein, partial [Vicinamibacterales bacterium]